METLAQRQINPENLGPRPYMCIVCDKTFMQKQTMQTHMKKCQ